MGQVASGFILLLEGEISGECPYSRSLYKKYFVLTNFRSEAVVFFVLVEWRSRIKLRNIKCENGDSMPQYLTKFTQCRDELGSVGVIIDDEELVSLALLGLPKSWHSYQDSVNGQEKLLGWERLWSDLVNEEIR